MNIISTVTKCHSLSGLGAAVRGGSRRAGALGQVVNERSHFPR